MTDEPRYTLSEAMLEINRLTCAKQGHDYNILETAGGDGPAAILCDRCGRSWNIVKEDR